MRLDTLAPEITDRADAQRWQDVLDIINIGDTDPQKAKEQPPKGFLSKTVGLLTEDLMKARKLLSDKGGGVVTRRMNESEYIHTVGMLTGVKLPEELVPDNESGEGLNTLGSFQTFSPAMLEQYEETAAEPTSLSARDCPAPSLPTRIGIELRCRPVMPTFPSHR